MAETDTLADEAALRTVYDEPHPGALAKVLSFLDPHARHFITLSPFFCIGTGREGGMADVSPRGGEPGFVHVLDDRHLAFPDRPGNNRLDTLANLTHTPAVGMLFFLPGVNEMLRINGKARISVAEDLMTRFAHDGRPPRSVIVVAVAEVYMHCAKALKRAELWNPEVRIERSTFPSLGRIVRDQMNLEVPAEAIDQMLDDDARHNLY